MTIDPAASGEQAVVAEIYPNIAAIASVYGDPNGDYVKFLTATGFAYTDDPTFMWDQPLASGDPVSSPNNSSSGSSPEKNGDRAAAVRYTERRLHVLSTRSSSCAMHGLLRCTTWKRGK
ncbi:hypothetical protein B0H14DRAFT_2731162 [Mycena olivaceomarginata]|nr:hypothetical protein B0H14DRAFT_2731162 [Mycena olivaceomarginata]